MNKYLVTYQPEYHEPIAVMCEDFIDMLSEFRAIIKRYPGTDIEVFELTKIY